MIQKKLLSTRGDKPGQKEESYDQAGGVGWVITIEGHLSDYVFPSPHLKTLLFIWKSCFGLNHVKNHLIDKDVTELKLFYYSF